MKPPRTISEHDRKLLAKYTPLMVEVVKIKPSPENSEIYGAVNFDNDPALRALIRSIQRRGLEEPLILTDDHFILSGHRRFFAVQKLKWSKVPARYAGISRGDYADHADYHRLLTEYNPQRIKSVAATLSEKLLAADKDDDDDDDSESWTEYRKAKAKTTVQRMKVTGEKPIEDVGPRQREFLQAAQKVIEELNEHWPLSVRQVHYKLLNDPPLTQTTREGNEEWRYCNNMKCYNKLSSLLVMARYHGYVAWDAIDDATRDSLTHYGFQNPNEFIGQQVDKFLEGFHRDRQEGQPNHIELIVEKNTLLNILRGTAKHFYVPLTAMRGYGGPSLWREIELRWRAKVESRTGSNKPKCILIIVSDHDPEGLDLANDAVKSLRDRHGVDVVATRPAITLRQARQLNLKDNYAKEGSSRLKEYVRNTGTTSTWEVEALEPAMLIQLVHDAILKAMDTNQLNAVQEREVQDKQQIRRLKDHLGGEMQRIIAEGGF